MIIVGWGYGVDVFGKHKGRPTLNDDRPAQQARSARAVRGTTEESSNSQQHPRSNKCCGGVVHLSDLLDAYLHQWQKPDHRLDRFSFPPFRRTVVAHSGPLLAPDAPEGSGG